MKESDIKSSKRDEGVYFHKNPIVIIFVDDILALIPREEKREFMKRLRERFKCGEDHDAEKFIGMKVKMLKDVLNLNQLDSVENTLKRFGMENCTGSHSPVEG